MDYIFPFTGPVNISGRSCLRVSIYGLLLMWLFPRDGREWKRPWRSLGGSINLNED